MKTFCFTIWFNRPSPGVQPLQTQTDGTGNKEGKTSAQVQQTGLAHLNLTNKKINEYESSVMLIRLGLSLKVLLAHWLYEVALGIQVTVKVRSVDFNQLVIYNK